MTCAPPRTARLSKSQKWLGRLLGCVALPSLSCSRGVSGSGSSIELSDTVAQQHTDINRNEAVKPSRHRYRKHAVVTPPDPKEVVLLGARRLRAASATQPLALLSGSPVSGSGGALFGELEMALFREGLLEYRDPQASVPVLNIGYGFTDEELRTLSKSTSSLLKNKAKWCDECRDGLGYDKFLAAQLCGEHLIDGLPASVWLECVEPTLSILITLNSLRHRRSNLSLKKGLPETLDSNRSRHGDFEFGPVAIFHHPGRIQQMMLLRVEFLNAAAAQQGADVNQSADHNGRRSYNRHRRFRQPQFNDIFDDDTDNSNHDALNISRNNTNCNNHNSNTGTGMHCRGSEGAGDAEASGNTVMDCLSFQGDNVFIRLENQDSSFDGTDGIWSQEWQPWTDRHERIMRVMTIPRSRTLAQDGDIVDQTCNAESSEDVNNVAAEGHLNKNGNARPTVTQSAFSAVGALVTASCAVMLSAAVPNSVEPPPMEPPPLTAITEEASQSSSAEELSPLIPVAHREEAGLVNVPRATGHGRFREKASSVSSVKSSSESPCSRGGPVECASAPLVSMKHGDKVQGVRCEVIIVKETEEERAEGEEERAEGEEEEEEEEMHVDAGDNEFKRLVPESTSPAGINEAEHATPSTNTSTTTTTNTQPQTSTPTTSTTTTPTQITTNQPVDVLALGDYTLWSLLPGHRVHYIQARPSQMTQGGGAASGSSFRTTSTRHQFLAYSRNFAQRARSAWSRWRFKASRVRGGMRSLGAE
ncbi:hypothetical protein V1264_016508 [Littorina saxatilis]|uniref:Uncharacterized protein n=1 Tax=Littorina saxatilis TaxID=31220 RepID=A0AAN9GI93_9CAEN